MERIFHTMLQALKRESNKTLTENGAVTLKSTGSETLDLFATVGALRSASDTEIIRRFTRSWTENPDIAMKLLFYARDIRGGLGERRVFRTILSWIANNEPSSVIRNIPYIAEYGRFDDLLILLDTPCEKEMLMFIKEKLKQDIISCRNGQEISLLAKWLPSVNASNPVTRLQAKKIAKKIGLRQDEYRKTLSELRLHIRILENNLRERDYSFDYEKQPSKAMFKYRKAFIRNDNIRYTNYLNLAQQGKATIHTGTLMPYEIIRKTLNTNISQMERKSLDITWNNLENYADNHNALAVIDGSGSMYWGGNPCPGDIALSLGIYFAEHNTGAFHNHFITFSTSPRLIEIQGTDITEKVRFCRSYNECSNTNIQKVFELILQAALKNNLPQEEMPETLYFISDMEFDSCARNASLSNFEYAKGLYESHGYKLPQIIFWNVQSRNKQQPVEKNEQGVALVSGSSPKIFSMVMNQEMNPEIFMMKILGSERYAVIHA